MRLTANLGRLSDFGADDFPFACFVLFDRGQQSCALSSGSAWMRPPASFSEPYLVFCEVGIMHVLIQFEFEWCTWTPTAYLVPVFFHAPFCSVGECLASSVQQDTRPNQILTFAISLQLLPASRIVFSRCSSAGVQGVLVLLFLGADGCEDFSGCSSPCCA